MSALKLPLVVATATAVIGIGLARTNPATVEASLEVIRQNLHLAPTVAASATPAVAAPPSNIAVVANRIPSNPWRTEIEPNRLGQFVVDMTINGEAFDAMVDTGASYVALSYEAAARIGLHPSASDFKYVVETANGSARAAGAVIPRIRVGNVEANDVQVVISQPGALGSQNLLGMSFLRKLSGFQVESGRLVLMQ